MESIEPKQDRTKRVTPLSIRGPEQELRRLLQKKVVMNEFITTLIDLERAMGLEPTTSSLGS
jgi:hypothetical protein